MNKKKKKIVIFGLNNTGLKIYKQLKRKNKFKIKLITKNNYSKKFVFNFSPDFIFSLGYRKKIDPVVLKYAKLGSFNLHKNRNIQPLIYSFGDVKSLRNALHTKIISGNNLPSPPYFGTTSQYNINNFFNM